MSPGRHDDGLGHSTSALYARLGASRHRPGNLPFLSFKGLVWGILDDPEYCDWRSPPRSVAHQVIRAISSAPALGLDLPLTARRLACRIPDASPAKFQFPCLIRSPVRCTVFRHPCGRPPFPVCPCCFWAFFHAQCETRFMPGAY